MIRCRALCQSAENDSSFGPDGARHNPRYAVAVRDPQILQEAQELEKRGVGSSEMAFSWLFRGGLGHRDLRTLAVVPEVAHLGQFGIS